MKRRSILAVTPAILLAACNGMNPFTQKVQIDLATAKQWSQLITSSFDGFVISTAAAIPATAGTAISEADKLLDAANAQFQGLTDGSVDAKTIAADAVKTAQGLLLALQPFVPALAVTGPLYPEIQIGFVVLEAFINALAITPPAAPADATLLQASAAKGVALKAARR